MKRFRRGLVIGKFAPLHKGHELILTTALEACEQLHVVAYSNPELRYCAPATRLHWLRTLFPSADVHVLTSDFPIPIPPNDSDDATQRSAAANIYLALIGKPLDAVFTSEAYGPGFVDFLNAYFARQTELPANVQHVMVDQSRKTVPARGTEIRNAPYAFRHFLSPVVYRSFIHTACFLGAESTGKSTLTQQLAKHFDTFGVEEYGREHWSLRGGKLVLEDMLTIAQKHLRREEESLMKARHFLFVDTSPLTTLLYSELLFDKQEAALVELSQRKYDSLFLCAPDFPLVQDGTRQDEAFRQRQHRRYLEYLAERKLPYRLLTGSLEERVAAVERTLVPAPD